MDKADDDVEGVGDTHDRNAQTCEGDKYQRGKSGNLILNEQSYEHVNDEHTGKNAKPLPSKSPRPNDNGLTYFDQSEEFKNINGRRTSQIPFIANPPQYSDDSSDDDNQQKPPPQQPPTNTAPQQSNWIAKMYEDITYSTSEDDNEPPPQQQNNDKTRKKKPMPRTNASFILRSRNSLPQRRQNQMGGRSNRPILIYKNAKQAQQAQSYSSLRGNGYKSTRRHRMMLVNQHPQQYKSNDSAYIYHL